MRTGWPSTEKTSVRECESEAGSPPRVLLGFCVFLRNYVAAFSVNCKPLANLLRFDVRLQPRINFDNSDIAVAEVSDGRLVVPAAWRDEDDD